jgi:hypothetical protein
VTGLFAVAAAFAVFVAAGMWAKHARRLADPPRSHSWRGDDGD